MSTDPRLKFALKVMAVLALTAGAWAPTHADETDTKNQLTLADLAGYRAALSGKPTADSAQAIDRPKQVRFRELWNQPELFRGRRVIVQGCVERIFRQAAVGSFPPLAEVWITSPAGDPFCVVFPQNGLTTADGEQDGTDRRDQTSRSLNQGEKPPLTPDVGRVVRFTGTFLKMVTYTASDGKRLAPLIVGQRPPYDKPDRSQEDGGTRLRGDPAEVPGQIGGTNSRLRHDHGPGWGANWILALTLAALAAGIITWQHLRTPVRRHDSVRKHHDGTGPEDPTLEFIN
jgi:hypothetical protein